MLFNERGQRHIRDGQGQHVTSYAQLAGHRRQSQGRTHLLNNEADPITSAEKNTS